MNSEIVIADECWMDDFGDYYYLTNLIEKEEGENPKIVNGLGQSILSEICNVLQSKDLFTYTGFKKIFITERHCFVFILFVIFSLL